MKVEFLNETSRRVPRSRLKLVAQRAARLFALPKRTRVQLVFVTDRTMRALNRRTRHMDRSTNVLAFPLHGWWPGLPRDRRAGRRMLLVADDPDGVLRLGDIVISVDTAAREAKRHARPFSEETAMLVAHGLLHLLGFDHRDTRSEERMTTLTRRVLTPARVFAVANTLALKSSCIYLRPSGTI